MLLDAAAQAVWCHAEFGLSPDVLRSLHATADTSDFDMACSVRKYKTLLAILTECYIMLWPSIWGSCAQCRRRYNGFRCYANSKLAAILAAKELQRRFDRCALARHP